MKSARERFAAGLNGSLGRSSSVRTGVTWAGAILLAAGAQLCLPSCASSGGSRNPARAQTGSAASANTETPSAAARTHGVSNAGVSNAGVSNAGASNAGVSNAGVSNAAEYGRAIRRGDLLAVLSKGLPAFLATVRVSPSLHKGRFQGWSIVSIGRPPLGLDSGLEPGDIVIQVNGKPIEQPEEAMAVWQSLTIAPEIHVAYERKGVRRDLVYPIEE